MKIKFYEFFLFCMKHNECIFLHNCLLINSIWILKKCKWEKYDMSISRHQNGWLVEVRCQNDENLLLQRKLCIFLHKLFSDSIHMTRSILNLKLTALYHFSSNLDWIIMFQLSNKRLKHIYSNICVIVVFWGVC